MPGYPRMPTELLRVNWLSLYILIQYSPQKSLYVVNNRSQASHTYVCTYKHKNEETLQLPIHRIVCVCTCRRTCACIGACWHIYVTWRYVCARVCFHIFVYRLYVYNVHSIYIHPYIYITYVCMCMCLYVNMSRIAWINYS